MEFYSSEVFNYIINNKKKILEIQNNKKEELGIALENFIKNEEDLIEGE